MSKYQITRTNVVLGNAQNTLVSGRSDTTDLLGETRSLKRAIEIAHAANQNRTGYSGARVVQDDNHIIMMVDIPLAYKALQAFRAGKKNYPAANDNLTLSELRHRMDAYYYDVEGSL